jgi:hypothetical protein
VLNEIKLDFIDGNIMLYRIAGCNGTVSVKAGCISGKPMPTEFPKVIFGGAVIDPKDQLFYGVLVQRIQEILLPWEVKLIPNPEVSTFQKIVRAHLTILVFLLLCFNVASCIQSLQIFVTLVFWIPGELSQLADAVTADSHAVEQRVVAFGRTELPPEIFFCIPKIE